MRPRGEIRTALADSAFSLASERSSGVTWRDVASHAQVGWSAARKTFDNMVLAGELVKVGEVRVEGICRPLGAYKPAALVPATLGDRTSDLASAIRSWASFV